MGQNRRRKNSPTGQRPVGRSRIIDEWVNGMGAIMGRIFVNHIFSLPLQDDVAS